MPKSNDALNDPSGPEDPINDYDRIIIPEGEHLIDGQGRLNAFIRATTDDDPT